MVSDEVPLVVSRQLLQSFAQELGRLDADAQKEIAHYALKQIQPRVVSFEEQVLLLNLVIFPFLICLTNCLEYRDWVTQMAYLGKNFENQNFYYLYTVAIELIRPILPGHS